MSRQAGVSNAISQAGGNPDIHSFRRLDNLAPTANYMGVTSQGLAVVDPVPSGIIVCVPIIIPKGVFLNKFAYRITVNAVGENLRVGLYSNKKGTLFPESLIRDFGEFTLDSTGTFYTGVYDHFLHGKYVYWIATWVTGGAAWFAMTEPTDRQNICGYNNTGDVEASPNVGFKFPKVYDSIFPNPFPNYGAGTRFQPADEKNPGIFLRLVNP